MSNANKLTRAEQKALRPIQILDAAFEEFVANGFTATRVEDIAERIGVTKGTIYVYFPTKEELFSAMADYISKPLEDLLRDSLTLEGTCAARLKSLLFLFYERVSDDRHTRELIRLVISEGSRFPQVVEAHHDKLVGPLFALTQSLLDEGIERGEFRNAPAALAPVVVAPVIAMMVETLIFGGRRDVDLPSYIRAHLDLVMNGVAIVRDPRTQSPTR
ncbi:TetR/AcrR family transcriptional regulator [Kaistia algarum]|uniref:TetR/AcrR family transcriptional regulator n=1 Tax=Kaistia algarum TaxID=2083279 RepID=UPI000CE8DF92|nr:TetR/AcrR family transcriptional regulator [Kaistia algarum]MCX5515077.1 TetR/AcrR family transcriptional regulator [Kaistia algarum]PPE80002.1 TetR/AcrR family transcriptional regulator [Kaistia algarum]